MSKAPLTGESLSSSKKPLSISRGIRAFASRLSRPIGSGRASLSSLGSGNDPNRPKLFVPEAEMLTKIYKELSVHGSGEGVDCDTFLGFMALPPLWSQRFFARIDAKNRGNITCDEFIHSVALFCRGSTNDRIKLIFDVFDLNNDCRLQRSEVQAMLGALPDWHIYVKKDNLQSNSMACVDRLRSRDSTSLISPSPQSIHPTPFPSAPHDQVTLGPSKDETTSSCYEEDESVDSEDDFRPIAAMFAHDRPTEFSDDIFEWPADSEDAEIRRTSSSLPPPSRAASGVSSFERPAGENMPAPPILSPPSESLKEEESPMAELEDLVSAVFQTFGRPEGLSLSDFSRWVLHGGASGLLEVPRAGLREERWSLQGLAFNRSSNYCNEGSRRPSTSPCQSPAPSIEASPYGTSSILHLGHDQYFKLRRLFTQPSAPSRMTARPIVFGPLPPMPTANQVAVPTAVACEYPRMGREASLKVGNNAELVIYPNNNASLVGALLGDWRSEPLSCPKCFSPFIMCPRCHNRFPQLRLRDNRVITVECQRCVEGEPHGFCFCWFCLWSFSEALEMIGRSTVMKEGRLWKVGRHTHHWRSRHYVLIDQAMYYYSHYDDAKPRGFMYLEGCEVQPIAPSDSAAQPTTRRAAAGGKYGFSIVRGTGHRRDLFAATRQDADEWMQVLSVSLKRGQLEDAYQMGYEVGRGRFSVVYSAINKADGTERAVKVVKKPRLAEHERDQIRSEMSVLRLLRHRHVVRLYEIVDSSDAIHIVMEMVKGGELYELLRRCGRLTETQTKRFVSQLLETVAYLHECGIIHRDIKPENILLTDLSSATANIKIADFGLSCLCGPEEVLRQPCGTLAYAAPEIFEGGGYSHAVDVWAIGVVAYLLLQGRLPFPMTQPPTAATCRPNFQDNDLEPEAIDFLSKLLETDPSLRISATDAMLHPWLVTKQSETT